MVLLLVFSILLLLLQVVTIYKCFWRLSVVDALTVAAFVIFVGDSATPVAITAAVAAVSAATAIIVAQVVVVTAVKEEEKEEKDEVFGLYEVSGSMLLLSSHLD